MNLLALDIGTNKTGVAYYSSDTKIVLPLDTISHESAVALINKIRSIALKRSVKKLILGIPLLPSSKEGRQAEYVKMIAKSLNNHGFGTEFIDERYTTPRVPVSDGNAEAAISILSIFLRLHKLTK